MMSVIKLPCEKHMLCKEWLTWQSMFLHRSYCINIGGMFVAKTYHYTSIDESCLHIINNVEQYNITYFHGEFVDYLMLILLFYIFLRQYLLHWYNNTINPCFESISMLVTPLRSFSIF